MDVSTGEILLSSKGPTSKFQEFRQNLKFCDVSLQSGHAVVKAHRVVLAAASPYFEALFSSGLKETNEELVHLPSIPPEVLPTLVDFIYTGHVTIQPSTVQQLIVTAHMLCFDGLVTDCARYLKTQLDPSNALYMLSLAETLSCSELIEFTLAYIGEHWAVIAQQKELLELSLALLTKILSSEKFAVKNELNVVLAVVRWLEHDPATRAPHCAHLLRLLRLGRLPIEVLEDVWKNVKNPRLAWDLHLSNEKMEGMRDTRTRGCGAFYVVENPNGGPVGSVMKYHVYEVFWEAIVPMEKYRHCPGVAALGGRLYVVGGYNNGSLASGEVYDPAINKWSPIADMNHSRSDFGLAALKRKLYAFGGLGVDGVLCSVEAYDPATDKWAPAADLPYAMRDVKAVTHDGKWSLFRFDPRAEPQDAWCACAEMANERYEYAATVLDGHLYVVGGYDLGDRVGNTVERYSFTMDQWDYVTPKSIREKCVAAAADGMLLVAGRSSLQIYVPSADSWLRGPDLPLPHCVVGCAVL
ncbi:Kelch-like protein 17 [Eumeta japonica]|uniref:Kelch-like protein diablo n=1 Tax=Eumeta variegata TaxID=151549 RepID=A0A4C1VG04_EUMVA|nr:Kelch-like protein 17 [Eumeta japonica]